MTEKINAIEKTIRSTHSDKKNKPKMSLSSTTRGLILTCGMLTLLFLLLYPLIRQVIFGRSLTYLYSQRFQVIMNKWSTNQTISEQSMKQILAYVSQITELFVYTGVGLILLVALVALLSPYDKQSQAGIVRKFNNLKIEWKFGVIPFVMLIILAVGIRVPQIGPIYSPGLMPGKLLIDITPSYFLVHLVWIWPLAVYEYLIFTNLKAIANQGFRRGVVDNSLLFTGLDNTRRWFMRQIYPRMLDFFRIDLQSSYLKKITILSGAAVGLILVSMLLAVEGISTGTTSGLIIVVNILLIVLVVKGFEYLYQLVKKIDYLTEASAQIAGGNLSAATEGDFGLLSDLAQHLKRIDQGFQRAVQEEIRSQQLKNELITNVSHDLKTPLTSVINYADLLRQENLTQETRQEYVDIIYSKSKRLQTLIEDLFEVSKTGSGDVQLDPQELDVIDLFRQAIGELQDQMQTKGLKPVIRLPEEKVFCCLDGQKTHRIFENLLQNIVKYAMPGTRVYLEGEQLDQEFIVTFKNISSYEMDFSGEDVSERFMRGDKSRSTEGSGLGLAIAQNLLELQGGKLKIHVDGDLFKVEVMFPIKIKTNIH